MSNDHVRLDTTTGLPADASGDSYDYHKMKPVFIGGCGRSGTTLLGAMLSTHSQCLATPESKFIFEVYRSCMRESGTNEVVTALNKIAEHWSFKIWDININSTVSTEQAFWDAYPELIKWLVKQYARKVDKTNPEIWIDHTPNGTSQAITLLGLFPDAKIIHMIRDGRAAAASVMNLDWGPNTVATAAKWWMKKVAQGLVAESFFGPERIKQIRYENLILKPEATLKEICAFLQIEYQPEMVSGTGFQVPQYTARQHALVGQKPNVGRLQAWKKELTPRQIEIFESIALNFLSGLGYELMYGLGARRRTKAEGIAQEIWELYRREVANKFRRKRRIRQSISATVHYK